MTNNKTIDIKNQNQFVDTALEPFATIWLQRLKTIRKQQKYCVHVKALINSNAILDFLKSLCRVLTAIRKCFFNSVFESY